MLPAVSEPSAHGTRPPATALPEPEDDPPAQCLRFHGFSAGPVADAAGERYRPPPASSINASFGHEYGACRTQPADHGRVIREDLILIRRCAPARWNIPGGQQIFCAIGQAMERGDDLPASQGAISATRLPEGQLGS